MTRKKTDEFNFEASLAALNTVVEKMEKGDLSLEEALQCFEKGIALTRQCQKALKDAEQKVHVLMSKNGELSLEPFQPEE